MKAASLGMHIIYIRSGDCFSKKFVNIAGMPCNSNCRQVYRYSANIGFSFYFDLMFLSGFVVLVKAYDFDQGYK